MRREGWIYGLAFVVILGLGAWVIVPRILRLSGGSPPRPTRAPAVREDPVVAAPTAPAAPLRVRLRGPRGALLGPVKEVVGAAVVRDEAPGGGVADLHIRPTAAEVAFGASGHLWTTVDAADLEDGAVITLEEAAPPLIVRVREVDGGPAADVPVDVVPPLPGALRRTDGSGAVVLDDLAPGLVVVGVGGRERQGPVLRLVAGRDRDARAVLEPAWRVVGRAVDEGGRPVSGARVEGLGPAGVVGRAGATDEEGRFAWVGPVASALSIRLTSPGLALATREAAPPYQGTLETDLGDVGLARPVVALEGRVLAATRTEPVRVQVEPAVSAILRELFGAGAALDAPHAAEADEQGFFRIDDVPADLPLRISVRGGGRPLDDVVTAATSGAVYLLPDYTPPPGHALDGRVVDGPGGTPRAGLRLLVSSGRAQGAEAGPGDREVWTDGAGRFRVDALPLGPVYVRAYAPGRRPLFEEIVLPRATPAVLTLDATDGDPARRVEGIVVDEMNEPLPGVRVRAGGRDTQTDAGGRFVLDDVAGFGAQVVLTAAYEAATPPAPVDPTPFVAGARRAVSPGAGLERVVLSRSASLRLRALDGLDDVPLAFVHVLLRSEDGDVLVDRAVATQDGHVAFDHLLPRSGTLHVLSTRHRAVLPVLLRAGKVTDLGVLRLGRGIHVTGRVVNQADEPIAGAFLAGVEPGWLGTRGGDPAQARELDLRRAVAGADGTFVLDGFDPREPAVLAAWAPGYAPAARRVVLERFMDDVHVNLTVRLQRGGWFVVELKEVGGELPVSGALLDLENARNGSDYLDLLRRGMLGGTVAGDDDWRRASAHFLFEEELGRYRLGPAEPGPYEVWVDRPGYRPIRRKLTILDPAEAIIDLEGPRAFTQTLHLTWEMEPGE
jgi:hypothetical protein